MHRSCFKFVVFLALTAVLRTQPAAAQGALQRLRARRAAAAAAAQKQNQAGKPNERAMEGLPPKWVENLREMPPEDQERFMENNERFRNLPPQRQEQIRQNLDKWNKLSPEEKQAVRERERFLEQLTPEQRAYVRTTLLPKWQAMPQDRRQVINRHLAMLGAMSPATQEAALNDPKFMQGLSPDEQSMLRDLNSLRNPPPQ